MNNVHNVQRHHMTDPVNLLMSKPAQVLTIYEPNPSPFPPPKMYYIRQVSEFPPSERFMGGFSGWDPPGHVD